MRFDEFYNEVEYIFGEDIEPEMQGSAFQMAKENGVSILSDKEINIVAMFEDEVIGALWTAWSREEFSFDVVVRKDYQRQGIGKKLVDMAISTFNQDSEAYGDEAIIKADVVNPNMEQMLLKKGFKIEDKYPGHTIMVRN